jgi:hypothetical protein
MTYRSLIFLSVIVLVGCASPKRIDMGARFFTRPVQLLVEVKSATPAFDSAPLRYSTEIVVQEPASKRGKVVHLVIDGVSSDWQSLVAPGSRWWISADELIFDEEARFGLSLLSVDQMKPRKTEPNQAAQTTPGLRPSVSDL